jgi:tetratricopeptide (TPR) repeat protein
VDAFRQRVRQAGLIYATFRSADGLKLAAFQALTELAGTRMRSIPRQLPAATAHFAGRSAELATLSGLLRGRAEVGATVVISAIGGTAGVGKTALAIHFGHLVAGRFPDGQLYVNLRGFESTGTVMEPAEAVRRFLDALEVPPERIPVDLDGQAALYRSEVAGRRILIVLDNARDSAQVRPLLPGAGTCLVLVTSRNQLTSLAADGAQPLSLDLLTPGEAHELLARHLGADRVAAGPQAAADIISRCARLPLALALVAARAALRPHVGLHVLAGELRDAQQRWEMLTGDEPTGDVRSVFSWSYQALTPLAARLFRLLGLHPGPDITAPTAASLAGAQASAVRPLLGELVGTSVLVEHAPGRYTFHDLLRAYATDLTHRTDPDQERHAATGRILDHYLHTAYAADRLLNPLRDPIVPATPQAGVTPENPADYRQALAWFTAERAALLAAIDQAAATGRDTHTWQLSLLLVTYLGRRGHWHDLVTTGQAAVTATRRLADPPAQLRAHRALAYTYAMLGQLDAANGQLNHALDLAIRTDDQAGRAHTHRLLSAVWERRGHPAQALDHAQRALDLHAAAGHQAGRASALSAVGWCHALLGNYRQALISCQQALPMLKDLADYDGLAKTWDSLGYAHHHLGQYTQAVACQQRALALYRDLGDRYNETEILTHLGDTHHVAGNHQDARAAWREALTILNDIQHPNAETISRKLDALDAVPIAQPPDG